MIQRMINMECDECGRRWIAAMEDSASERLECPDCGIMVQVEPNTFEKQFESIEKICNQMDFLVSQNYSTVTVPTELLKLWSNALKSNNGGA
jgi:DNA-directed RNA polymerase subunit RPC12/RpoP